MLDPTNRAVIELEPVVRVFAVFMTTCEVRHRSTILRVSFS